jgi:hypothetical protein
MGSPELEALWKKVVDDWESDAPHTSFLRHCQETEQLGEAATRYAGMRGDRERGPAAVKRLEAVAILATSSLVATRGPRPEGLPRWLVLVTAVFFGAMVLYVFARVMRM